MAFQISPKIDPLPAHHGSLRLLRSEIYSSSRTDGNDSDAVKIFEDTGRSLSSYMHSAVYSSVNLEGYLCNGLNIVSRLPDATTKTIQFLSEDYSGELGREALKAIIDLGSLYCGEGLAEILAVVSGDSEVVVRCIDSAVRSHIGRVICIQLTDICRRVAAEYDAMASTMSFDEASDYLFSRFTGKGRIVDFAKLLLRTGDLLAEDRQNLHVVERQLNSTRTSFLFLWRDAASEARRLIDDAKIMLGYGANPEQLLEVEFWDLVNHISQLVPRSRISLDAVVAVALAELGVVLNCHAEGVSVLRAIAGDDALMTTKSVSLTNHGSVWIAPFRALTINRVVLALDGRTQLVMIDEYSGVKHTYGIFKKCAAIETQFVCCEPLPYTRISVVKTTMPKAFAALAKDGEPWNDGLQKELEKLSERKVPPDGLEVHKAVTDAQEFFSRNNVLAAEYTKIIFSTKRIIPVFTLASEQGRRMGDVLYQYSLMMVHPDTSKIGDRTVREVWNNVEGLPEGMRSFIENVRLSYEGWMVYPETGSAGVKQVRRRCNRFTTVWLGLDR